MTPCRKVNTNQTKFPVSFPGEAPAGGAACARVLSIKRQGISKENKDEMCIPSLAGCESVWGGMRSGCQGRLAMKGRVLTYPAGKWLEGVPTIFRRHVSLPEGGFSRRKGP